LCGREHRHFQRCVPIPAGAARAKVSFNHGQRQLRGTDAVRVNDVGVAAVRADALAALNRGFQRLHFAKRPLRVHGDERNLRSELRARNGATLYLSALGVGPGSPLLPCVGLSRFVTFWPICKELLGRRPEDLLIGNSKSVAFLVTTLFINRGHNL
jgi:hypothetical protein